MRHPNETVINFMAGMVAGAALMYILDPAAGRRRRAIVRDKTMSTLHTAENRMVHKSRDFRNRAQGTVATFKSRIHDGNVDDDILRARVRAELGHVCSHPRAIEILVNNGCVTLGGSVLEKEVDAVCRGIGKVRGVKEVRKSFETHADAGSVPELQS